MVGGRRIGRAVRTGEFELRTGKNGTASTNLGDMEVSLLSEVTAPGENGFRLYLAFGRVRDNVALFIGRLILRQKDLILHDVGGATDCDLALVGGSVHRDAELCLGIILKAVAVEVCVMVCGGDAPGGGFSPMAVGQFLIAQIYKNGSARCALCPQLHGIFIPVGRGCAGENILLANNEIGSIQPISEIGTICWEKVVTFHTDAVQAAGHLPIDVKVQNIDLLSLSAHKFRGPKGIGALYARNGILMTRLIEGGDQEQGRRAGTENVPAIMGMAAALEEACAHMAENTQKMSALQNRLIAGLSQIPDAVLNGDPENRLPGNVNFSFEGIEGESLVLLLDQHGICASTGSACTAQSLSPSHVLLAIGRSHEAATGALRLSLSEDNTQADVDEVLRIVPGLVRELRGKRVRNPFQRPL